MNKIQSVAAGLCAAAVTAAAASGAHAEVFSGTYDVSLNSADPGLVLNWSPIAPGLNFNLPTVGSSTDFDLFNLFTDEDWVNSGEDDVGKPIQVNFTFTLPSGFGGSITGETTGESFFYGVLQDGHVAWDNGGDALLNFAGGGQLLAHLDDANFNFGLFGLNEGPDYGAPIHATFTLNQGAVPEPATWAMMIIGFSMVGAGIRLSRRPARTASV
jgi:hypothetical protein